MRIRFLTILGMLLITSGLSAATYQVNSALECVNLALGRNQEILIGLEKLNYADAQVKEAVSTALPRIDFQGMYTRIGNNQGFPVGEDSTGQEIEIKMTPDDYWNASITLNQVIFAGGKVGAARKAAKYYRRAMRSDLRQTKQNIIHDTQNAYFGVILAERLIQVNEEALAQSQRHAENTRKLKDNGFASDYDVLRAEVAAANLKPNLIRARNNYKIAVDGLKLTMGLDPSDSLAVQGELVYQPYPIDLETALRSARENRPEIWELVNMAEVYQSGVTVARGNLLPNFNVQGSYAWAKDDLTFGEDSDISYEWRDSWRISGILTFPIFDGLYGFSKMDQARADLRQAKLQLEMVENGIKLEVRTALANLEQAEELIQSQAKTVSQAQESRRIAEARYNQGLSTQLDVNDARLNLTQAQTNEAQALYEYMVAKSAMLRAMGILDLAYVAEK